jgi:hypothetical protein
MSGCENLIYQFHIPAQTDAVKDVVGIIRQLIQSVQQHDLIGLHGPTGKQDMTLSFQHRHLGQGFGNRHRRRPVHDHAKGTFRSMLTEEDYGLSEVGIAEIRRGYKKDAFAELRPQRNLHDEKYPILPMRHTQPSKRRGL